MTSGLEDYVSTKSPSHPSEPYKTKYLLQREQGKKGEENLYLMCDSLYFTQVDRYDQSVIMYKYLFDALCVISHTRKMLLPTFCVILQSVFKRVNARN